MTNLSDYNDRDFFMIENGDIEFFGYFYDIGEGWRHYDYGGSFRLPVKDFIEKYNRDYSEAYEDIAISGTHYILAEDDGPDTLQEIQDTLDEWLKGTKPMKLSDITEDTPDGHYVTM